MISGGPAAWLEWVVSFSEAHTLWKSGDSLALAVSGGPDSTALAHLGAHLLKTKKAHQVRLLFVNHQHRAGTAEDEAFVVALGRRLKLSVDVIDLPVGALSLNERNFELKARKLRHRALESVLAPGEKLLSAHHLDDSFEWWLAQSFKSSNPEALGIPLVRGPWRRPFLCVSKAQILSFLKEVGQPYQLDPTASDLKLERNYLRASVIPAIKARYPKALRHYVRRVNALALEWGVHRWSAELEELDLKVYQDALGGVLIYARFWEEKYQTLLAREVKRIVEQLSEQNRGELHEEVLKTVRAVAGRKKGPMHLSGGIRAYLAPNALYLIDQKALSEYQRFEELLLTLVSIGSQIPEAFARQCALAPIALQGPRRHERSVKTSLFERLWPFLDPKQQSWAFAYQVELMLLDSPEGDR